MLSTSPPDHDGNQKHPSYGLTTGSAETTSLVSSSLFLADEVTLIISNMYSSQAAFFPFLLQPSDFNSLNSFLFNTQAETCHSKGMFVSEHFVSALRAMPVGSCPHPSLPECYTQ